MCLSVFVYADDSPLLKRTGKEFDASIPTIQSVLGYDFGERITRHSEMERYLQALAKTSPKVSLQKIGESYEGRALYYLIISSEQNIARLEELRLANLELSDPRKTTESEADQIIERNPVFVALTYGVHGAEHSSTEAALALAYYLISSNDSETTEWLKNCVIVLDPSQNPDGRERFISYFYSVVGPEPNADPNAAEHNQAWPGGRYNHYLFDMNRDWTVLSQQETRARVEAYRLYQPEIFIDVHEMTEDSSYFFPPPSIPRNPNVPPSMVEWWNLLGREVAAEFDRHQVAYFTSERFDFWYPGYGDGWPTYNGALTGTFEQASVRGLVRKRYDGVLVHYKDAIWHHFLSSRSVCRLASAKRKEKLLDYYHFRSTAIQEGKTGEIREFIIRRATDPLQADRVVEKLVAQGIEVHQAAADFKLIVHDYFSNRSESAQFLKGDYIIFMNQPLKRLIRATFEKETPFDANFLEAEEKRRKEKEPSELYDITAWALPYALGVETYWSGEETKVPVSAVQNILHPVRTAISDAYAYVIDYNGNQSLSAINKLLERHIRIYFSTKPFSTNGKEYPAGSWIIRTGEGNPANLAAALTEIANATGVQIDSVQSGWTAEGPDVGSDDVYFLRKPKIGVLTHMPTDPTSYGAVAHLLEQRFGIPFTALQTYDLINLDIREYNVLVVPDQDTDWGRYKD
ncbi:MAG TPA: M14 family zinc carboxypeptidase, partial [Acidobacteriota bacterium]|nr:M14 family zinc carboxypeptidase [Acidobacteriota bacterium]